MTEPGNDEMYCQSCGEVIKENAEICPECGVRNGSGSTSMTDSRKVKLEKIARKNHTTVILLSIFISPLGYYWVDETGLALLNFFTANYLLLGPVLVPLHTHKIMKDAKKELNSM
jgi:hypothetical protein